MLLDSYDPLKLVIFSSCCLLILILIIYQRHRKARKILRLSNQFFCLFNRKKGKFVSLFRLFDTTPLFQGVKIKTLDDFLGCFKSTEREGIELVFKTLSPHEPKKVSVTATDINGTRTYRIDMKPAGNRQDTIILHIADITQLEHEKLALRLEGKSLSSNLELVKKALDHLPIPVWVRYQNELLYANNRYTALTGHNLSKDYQTYRKDLPWSKLSRGYQPKTVIMDGQRKLFSFKETSIGSGHSLGYGMDQTAIESRNKRLSSFLKSYQNVLDSLSASIAIYDDNANLSYYNHAYRIMFSFDETFLSSKPHLGEVLDDLTKRRYISEQPNYPRWRQEQVERIKTTTHPEENLLHTPNGRAIRKICAPHAAGGSFYVFEDVTDKLKLMRQYKTQLEVYSVTLDNLYEGVAVFGSDNRLRLSNAAFARIWNVEPSEVKPGMHLSDLAEGAKGFFSASHGWEEYKSRVIDRVTDRIPKKRKIERSDGSVLEFSYMPLPDGSNLMSYIDVTERDRIKQVLIERNQALKTATRIKTQFLSEISQQLRPSLTTITGYADILYNDLREHAVDKTIKQKAAAMHQSSNIMVSQIKNILDLGMLESGEIIPRKQLVVLWKILFDAQKHLHDDLINHHAKISCKFPSEEFLFWADPELFRAAIIEIVRTALRAIGQAPLLVLTGKIEGKTARICIDVQASKLLEQKVVVHRLQESLSLELIRKALHLHASDLEIQNKNNTIKIILTVQTASQNFNGKESFPYSVPADVSALGS